jgi:hypothetical protein
MSPRHIYNHEGFWVAFVVGDQVFSCGGDLMGHLVDNHEIYGRDGSRLGTLTQDGRLFSSLNPFEPG